MFTHMMRGLVLILTSRPRRHSSDIPPMLVACDLHDRLITARDGIQYDKDVSARITHLQVLREEPPLHRQKMVRLLKAHLAITPKALSAWEIQIYSERALL